MSTPNFYLRNLSEYYVVGIDDAGDNEEKLNQQLQNIADDLCAKGWRPWSGDYNVTRRRGDFTDWAPGVAVRQREINTPAGVVSLEVAVVVNHGYEGACLDVAGRWSLTCDCYDAFSELSSIYIADDYNATENYRGRFSANYAPKIITDEKAAAACAEVKRVRDELREQAEAICARYADAVLRCRGVMCNGEAWYEAV